MSEKIYSLLFRLFPQRFRERWQADALELFRNRAIEERGLVPRLRLWFDLLSDLAVSVPHAHLREEKALVPANATRGAVPSFMMLEEKPIRSSAFLFGTIFSLTFLLGISLLAKHAGHFPISRSGGASEASGIMMDPWATGHASGGGGDGGTEVIGNGKAGSASATTAAHEPAARVVQIAGTPGVALFDSAERKRVLAGIGDTLKRRYADAALGAKLGETLRANERSGRYDAASDPQAFAARLTEDLRSASRDTHFEVVYSAQVLHVYAPPAAGESAAYRAIMLQANCTFEKIAVLPHNIGYLKLDAFPDPEVCADTAIAAMKKLSRGDGLIIDLRENSGGSPEMVKFLGGWLFDRPAFFWNPRENSAANMWTHSPMAGSGLAGKPVWVLTSPQTYSAAEQFSYNLKMLHRATLVGEATAGATDVGEFHRIDDHFGIGLRESKVANPYPAPDWALHGVEPDVHVSAAQALETAEKLAGRDLARR